MKKIILIVDDSKEIREIVKTTLDSELFKVYEASSGSKAIESAKKYKPDLIIMDVIMPGLIDGIDAIRQIKNCDEIKDCKIIILTGSELDRKEEGLSAGAVDFFFKPFSPLDLLDKIDRYLGMN
ncbi:MAG TPA: response regulator [Chitinispirillaceae bacterium]|nr:response regulator [Chitinispirillaceae bacterium]